MAHDMDSGFKCDPRRVIIHLDLDAFYTQVEHRRLGIPRDVPLAVQQWQGLIAINYPARAHGISRHMTAQDAIVKCPDIRLVHVQTVGENGLQDDDDSSDPRGHSKGRDRSNEKVTLERYRRASREVMAIIRREMGPTSVMERASIDEAYLDVTSTVDALLSALAAPQPPEPAICRASGEWAGRRPSAAQAWAVAFWQRGGTLAEAMAGGGGAAVGSDTVVVGGPLQDGLESDQRLRLGALLAARIRERVLAELTFTCSAGVAPNKLLAKIGSAMHKPSQQTVILPRGVGSLMGPMPLRKIGGFGGKLGDALARLGCVTAGDVCGLPPGTLDRIFEPQTAEWVAKAARGESSDAVVEKEKPKSMLAAKSFAAATGMQEVARWLRVLGRELAERIIDDSERNERWPKNLVLHFRRLNDSRGPDGRSRRQQFPADSNGTDPSQLADILADAAAEMLRKCAAEAFPCTRLALSTTEFVSRAAPHAAIANLLRAGQPKGSRSEDPRHDSHRRPESTSGAGLQRVPDSTKTGDTVDHHPHFRPGAGHLATSNDSFVREGPLASLFCGKRKRGRSIDEGQSEEGRGRLMGGAFAGSKKSALESFGGSDMRADDCEGASRRVVEHGVDDIDVPATKPSVSVDASESPGRLRAPEPPGRLVASGRGRRWRKQTRALLAEVFGTDDSACDLVSSAETSEGVQGGQTRSTGADILKGHLSVTGVAGGDGRAGGSGSDEEGEDVEGFWCDILGAGWGRDGEEEVEEGIVDGVGHSGGNDEADDEASKQRDGWGHSGGNEGLGTRDEEEGREYGRTDGCASEVPVHRGVGGERMRRQGIRDLWASHMAREGGDATRRCDSATRQAVRNQGAGGGGGEAKNGTLYMLFKRAKESMPVHVKTEAGAWVDVSGRSGGARWCARREEGEKETRYWTGGDNGGGRERGEAKRDGHDGNRNMPSGDDQNFAEEVGSLADELGVDLREQRLILADLEHQRKIDTICALGRSKQGRDGRAHQGAGVSKQKGGRWGGHGGSVVAMLQQVARRPGIDGKAVEEGDIPDFGHNP